MFSDSIAIESDKLEARLSRYLALLEFERLVERFLDQNKRQRALARSWEGS